MTVSRQKRSAGSTAVSNGLKLLLLACTTLCVRAQTSDARPRGFSSATDSTKVNGLAASAVPECSAKHMIVHLKFNRTLMSSFDDWIVVGTNSHAACRHQGHGELDYIIEIPLMNDPCGTKMVDTGTFENVIRIGQNPLIILRGDELITVRCFYGPPEIVTPSLPEQSIDVNKRPTGFVPSIHGVGLGAGNSGGFNQQQPDKSYVPRSQQPDTFSGDSSGVKHSSRQEVVNYGYVYFLVLPILLLALLCMICGCLFALVKRRNLRIERRKQIVNALPQSSELSKLGLSHLWWNGKSSVSNDALLSHDYMISSNSTREALSVTTDYGASSATSGSNSVDSPPNDGPLGQQPLPKKQSSAAGSSSGTIDQHDNDDVRQPISVAVTAESTNQHRAQVHGGDTGDTPPTARSPKSYSEWRQELLANGNVKDARRHVAVKDGLYSAVDKHNSKQQRPPEHAAGDRELMRRTVASAQLRSITEIYASVDREVHSKQHGSMSTLEGDQSGAAAGAAAFVPTEAQALAMIDGKRQFLKDCIRAVEGQRGYGPRKLTTREIEQFRQLVRDDPNLVHLLCTATGIDDFEAIGRRAEYHQLLTDEKWQVVAHSLAHMTFMSRLNGILNAPDADQGPIDETQVALSGKRRYVKRSEHTGAPRRASESELHAARETVASNNSIEPPTEKAPPPPPPQRTTSQLSTAKPRSAAGSRASDEADDGEEVCGNSTEVEEPPSQIQQNTMGKQQNLSQSSSSAAPDSPAQLPSTLHVYVGNAQQDRPLPRPIRDKFDRQSQQGLNSAARYAAMLESNASCATTTYDNWQVNQ